MKKTIFLMGPTASGKTELSLALAKELPIEIISVDSAMVYRGMDIGTGKPTPEELLRVPHHLIDIRDPSEPYSAAEFAKDALVLIEAIKARDRIPLLVGGTMLYFKALQEGLSELPSANPDIRAKLLDEANQWGWPFLHKRLASIDPESAKRIHPHDSQRIQRALEIFEISGKTMTSFIAAKNIENEESDLQKKQDIQTFVILPEDRLELHQRIEQRFYHMLEQGLVAEVQTLFNRGDLNLNMPSMRAVGYKQVWHYLAGEYAYDAMVNKAVAATRQLAKRQLTWLRNSNNNEPAKKVVMNHLASLQTMIHCVTQGE